MSYYSFEQLDVWKKSCRLCVEVIKEIKFCKNSSLKDQIQRSALSIPSNIAEGAERDSKKEFFRFLHISKGSSGELRTQLYIADQIGEINPDKRKEFCNELIVISKMLHALINSLKQSM